MRRSIATREKWSTRLARSEHSRTPTIQGRSGRGRLVDGHRPIVMQRNSRVPIFEAHNVAGLGPIAAGRLLAMSSSRMPLLSTRLCRRVGFGDGRTATASRTDSLHMESRISMRIGTVLPVAHCAKLAMREADFIATALISRHLPRWGQHPATMDPEGRSPQYRSRRDVTAWSVERR